MVKSFAFKVDELRQGITSFYRISSVRGGGVTVNKELNRFIVKCVCEEKVLIDISVDNEMCANYVSSLQISDVISFKGMKYSKEHVELIHHQVGSLWLEVIVYLKQIVD
ncbi:hypothetical protein [Bacillus sp. 2205SS5-2]|uniref:hypothetical protein n=1 Tax=Bacillus sp. 2205SS5-2 TaxID=3109031 RepID=UPI0030061347